MTLPDEFREVNMARHPCSCIGCKARAWLVIIAFTMGTEGHENHASIG
jgi:hypothetical protein